MAAPQFIDSDVNSIKARMIAAFQTETGTIINDTSPVTMLINAMAYTLSQHCVNIQNALQLGLAKFSNGAILDLLAENVGVTRLPEQPATINVQFTSQDTADVTIAAGTRIASTDGAIIFEVIDDFDWSFGSGDETTLNVLCEAITPGLIGNNWQTGSLTSLLDPIDGIQATVSNTTISAGGTALETDANLYDRIKNAPNNYTVAGPTASYESRAKDVRPDICDAKAITEAPGIVNVYVLTTTPGTTSDEILDQVQEALSAENIRPTNDTVEVTSAEIINYTIDLSLTKIINAVDSDEKIIADITAVINSYILSKSRKMGMDIIRNKIIGLCMANPNIYDVELASPSPDIIVTATQAAQCNDFTVGIIGTSTE